MTRQQRSLFSAPDPQWEEDDLVERLIATVVLSSGPRCELDYAVPDPLRAQLSVGQRVRVPLGRANRTVVGYCVALENRRDAQQRYKPIKAIEDRRTLLSTSMLKLTQIIAKRYLVPWATVLDAVVPSGVRQQAGTRIATLLQVEPRVAATLSKLKLPPKQAAVLQHLAASPSPMSLEALAAACGCTVAPINALRKKGLIQVRRDRVASENRTAAAQEPPQREDDLELNPAQEVAFQAIVEGLHGRAYQTLLLHGVTGSGKTEVYIRAIQEAVRFGRQSIVLVPEISLTPQTVGRFRSRFDHVAVLHSHLSDSERHRHWQEIASGQIQVVVGARSAVFAPVPNLGLIILDEEHEATFKQDSAPRYHARDVALDRARLEGIPLILGSATPSLESWHRAEQGQYRLLSLPDRVMNRPMPEVGVIDLCGEGRDRRFRGAISRQLFLAMRQTLDHQGQIILLLNRRGFATHIQCPQCGEVVQCPDCEIALTHHRHDGIALCHYCDYQSEAPSRCPQCQHPGIRYSGMGTQKLEAEVRARFPDAMCVRMDTDAMRKPGSHAQALDTFRSGNASILLGTQMIAKGLDFPNVTLVGVIQADTALHLPDFRAAERTFQLLAQVAGRAGRGDKGGRVLVQTLSPDHPAIQCALRHDYVSFVQQELPARQGLGYPPFGSLARIVVRSPSKRQGEEWAMQLAQRCTAEAQDPTLRVLGPAPAPNPKLRGNFRFHFQIHAADDAALHDVLVRISEGLKPPEGVEWIIDVDPVSML
jgi:primosomal protein N' (replication factor Y)